MTGQLGRVLIEGRDCGSGFALGPRLVITAHHVVRGRGGKPVVYVPAGGEAVGVERVEPDASHDAAILWLVSDVGEFLPTSVAVRGAGWRVESPPPGENDPPLHGTVTTARMTIQKAKGQPIEVVQLEVDEQLGDFGGYSGSAVLDSLGRVALALLVEQKPLRTPVALGERGAASNVLYAVPIGDVITALGLSVRVSRPLRFDVGLLPPGMVTRARLLDEAVGRAVGAEGVDAGAGLVLLRGSGGLGKTVLARQVADDVRVWGEFADGIVMLRAGQAATADSVARQLQEVLGCRDRDLADVLAGQRLLLIVDDVWDRELLGTLRAGLPPTVTVLATTRGVSVPGAVAVPVGPVGRDEAIEILARGATRSGELDRALDGLAEALFRWALLLRLAAAEIHRDDELGWGFDDEDSSPPEGTALEVLIGRTDTLRAEFPDDPTMLDELERTPEGAPPRSVEVLVRRSLDWLGPEHQARFELLAIYPPGAAITQPMLEDLWQAQPNATRKEIKLLVRAGLAQPVPRDRFTIELHDLITAWLHHERRRPGDARHQPIHQRLAGLSLLPDGSPGKLTRDRAEWLAYHLVSAGAWDRLKALPTLRWRTAFLIATGSDAAFLAGLDHYGHGALAQAPDALYHAVRAWLVAAHVRALIGQLPVPLLVAMALVGDPIAGITQAGQHPRAGQALPAVVAAVADRLDTGLLIERTLAVAGAIPGDRERGEALVGIAKWLAGADPSDPALVDRAVAVAETIPGDVERGEALAAIAGQLADVDPARAAALIDRAVAVAETIPGDRDRGEALAGIAKWLAGADPSDPALVDRAVAVAETIPGDRDRGEAVAAIAGQLAGVDPARAAALMLRAVAVAGAIPGDWDRGWALADIAGQLAGVDPSDPALVDRAVAVAGAIRGDWERSEALAVLAGRLAGADLRDPALVDRALAVTAAIPDDPRRGMALAVLAGQLAGADPSDPALVDRAVAMAGTIPDDVERGDALAAIAGQLAGADPARAAALIDRAVALARAIPDDVRRGVALAGLAGQLAGADPSDPALIDRALAVAGTIPRDQERSWALADIVRRLADVDPARAAALIDRAVAGAIPGDWDRGWALADIAGQLAGADPSDPALVDRALAVAGTIPGDGERGEALADIAGQLAGADPSDPALVDRALAVAGAIPGDWERSWALADIAGQLAGVDPARAAALIDRAVAGIIPDDVEYGMALAGIAGQLAGADPSDPALVDRALAVAGAIPGDRERSWALADIAGQLAGADPSDPALVDRALAVAGAIPGDRERSWALADIAGQLAGVDPARAAALVDRAVAVAGAIPGDRERGEALAGIAGQLAGADPSDPALVDRAVAVAGTIPGDRERGGALAGIAGQLAGVDPARAAALVDQAVAVAGAIPGDWDRGWALADIAGQLAGADPSDPALVDRAVAVAGAIPGDQERSWALADIAGQLAGADLRDPALVGRAVAVAGAIPGDQERSRALADIAGQLAGADLRDPALVGRAVAVAGAIPGDVTRSEALADIAWQLAGADPSDPALVGRAVAVAGAIPGDSARSKAVTRIHALTRSGMLDELSRWRLRPLGASIDLLNVFLGNSHDKAIAERIGLVVLDVVKEFPAKT